MTTRLYPVPNDLSRLSFNAITLKVARHSACSACRSCTGLHPSPDVTVIKDDSVDPDAEDIESDIQYLDDCDCGHDAMSHGDQESVSNDERVRRRKVAIRLDELLEDKSMLLDFEYQDEDMTSLRKQMSLYKKPSINGSKSPTDMDEIEAALAADPDERPAKRRRLSSSSLSGQESAEEDLPLAAKLGRGRSVPTSAPEHGSAGKKSQSSMTTTAQSGPGTTSRPVRPAQNGTVAKIEEKVDADQLSRLANGVTIDPVTDAPPPTNKEKAAAVELRSGIIRVMPVQNDASPRSLIILTGLKSLFQRQLPKMPREYIARLVYDENSRGLAIVKHGFKVVGGICFRPFTQRKFAEIVFFATASADQEKGYGAMLMNYFKMHIRSTYPNMTHFLTYADNYAVGYFKKQGFSKEIYLDRSVWAGYIKDYEGGTIMQCKLIPKVDYLKTQEILTSQREAVMTKIRMTSGPDVVYPGLPQFQPGMPENVVLDPKEITGLRETGWTPNMVELPKVVLRSPEAVAMAHLLADLIAHKSAWPFLKPVDAKEVADYYDMVKNPMDFQTMEHKLDHKQYNTLDEFLADAELVFENCKSYNPSHTIYHKSAVTLQKFLKEKVADRAKLGL